MKVRRAQKFDQSHWMKYYINLTHPNLLAQETTLKRTFLMIEQQRIWERKMISVDLVTTHKQYLKRDLRLTCVKRSRVWLQSDD